MSENIEVSLVEENITASIIESVFNVLLNEPSITVNLSESESISVAVNEEIIIANIGTETINVAIEAIGYSDIIKWIDLATGYYIAPVQLQVVFEGELYLYTYLDNEILYRAIYSNGDDIFYRTYSNNVLSDEVARKTISIG